eukprot:scaffold55520_cov55-Phaeocystis_antarctica.AAC.2
MSHLRGGSVDAGRLRPARLPPCRQVISKATIKAISRAIHSKGTGTHRASKATRNKVATDSEVVEARATRRAPSTTNTADLQLDFTYRLHPPWCPPCCRRSICVPWPGSREHTES